MLDPECTAQLIIIRMINAMGNLVMPCRLDFCIGARMRFVHAQSEWLTMLACAASYNARTCKCMCIAAVCSTQNAGGRNFSTRMVSRVHAKMCTPHFWLYPPNN